LNYTCGMGRILVDSGRLLCFTVSERGYDPGADRRDGFAPSDGRTVPGWTIGTVI